MKKNKKITEEKPDITQEKITRKEAIKKAGLAAFSAATMLLLLSRPENAKAQDSEYNPDDPDTW